jgi:hypothetical protein
MGFQGHPGASVGEFECGVYSDRAVLSDDRIFLTADFLLEFI